MVPVPDLGVFKAAVHAAGEAILITSAELDEPGPRIEYANPAFTRLTGYAAHEVIGRSPRFLQGPGTERAVLDCLREALEAGEPVQGEALNYRKDGTTYTVEWLITPVRDADGRIARWVSAQRDISERRAAEERQSLLVRELHHRVKNTLATVQAVLNATLRSSLGLSEFRQAFTGRIASLAKTHALITEERTQVVPFGDLVSAEVRAYDEPGRRIALRGPRVILASELAVPVGMALHELATNAVRHGALADPDGRLEVTWSVGDGPGGPVLHWTWNEHDGPPVALPTREGFGSQFLNRVLTLQIGAEVDIAFDPDGLRVTVAVPLSGPAQRRAPRFHALPGLASNLLRRTVCLLSDANLGRVGHLAGMVGPLGTCAKAIRWQTPLGHFVGESDEHVRDGHAASFGWRAAVQAPFSPWHPNAYVVGCAPRSASVVPGTMPLRVTCSTKASTQPSKHAMASGS